MYVLQTHQGVCNSYQQLFIQGRQVRYVHVSLHIIHMNQGDFHRGVDILSHVFGAQRIFTMPRNRASFIAQLLYLCEVGDSISES